MANVLAYVRSAKIADLPAERFEVKAINTIDVGNLPGGLVVGQTLLDVSAVQSSEVRAGLSLALLFASRVATHDPNATDEDAWLASYQTALGQLGFALSGTARMHSEFKKRNVSVHKAILPFLTIAFGGAAVGPIILAALDNLQQIAPETPWITLFNQEASRFSVKEMHFGAAVPQGDSTQIRYAIARLNIELDTTQILFFKITESTAKFESLTTSMTASSSLMAAIEDDLRGRLEKQIKRFIFDATIE